jgi:hypothetical protein
MVAKLGLLAPPHGVGEDACKARCYHARFERSAEGHAALTATSQGAAGDPFAPLAAPSRSGTTMGARKKPQMPREIRCSRAPNEVWTRDAAPQDVTVPDVGVVDARVPDARLPVMHGGKPFAAARCVRRRARAVD